MLQKALHYEGLFVFLNTTIKSEQYEKKVTNREYVDVLILHGFIFAIECESAGRENSCAQ
jgi:hypothetical protein